MGEKVRMEGGTIRLRNRRVSLYRTKEEHPVYGGRTWLMKFKYLNYEKPREVLRNEVTLSDESMKALLSLYVEHLAREGEPDAREARLCAALLRNF